MYLYSCKNKNSGNLKKKIIISELIEKEYKFLFAPHNGGTSVKISE